MERNGIDCDVPAGQVCCGAPWLHSGDVESFRKQGRKNVKVLADAIREAIGRGEKPAVVVPQLHWRSVLQHDYQEYPGVTSGQGSWSCRDRVSHTVRVLEEG